jgi:putative Ca2+/H+ antiporter (TMEM165/GDT1 family)
MKDLWLVFVSVFLAELGDKTQLATLLFASNDKMSRWGVFSAAALALVVSSALAVTLGGQISRWISAERLHLLAGIGFIAIGVWTIYNNSR